MIVRQTPLGAPSHPHTDGAPARPTSNMYGWMLAETVSTWRERIQCLDQVVKPAYAGTLAWLLLSTPTDCERPDHVGPTPIAPSPDTQRVWSGTLRRYAIGRLRGLDHHASIGRSGAQEIDTDPFGGMIDVCDDVRAARAVWLQSEQVAMWGSGYADRPAFVITGPVVQAEMALLRKTSDLPLDELGIELWNNRHVAAELIGDSFPAVEPYEF